MQSRSDLIAVPRTVQGEINWIVKDPIRLNYFCYSDQAYFVLDELNRGTQTSELQRKYESRFGVPLTEDNLRAYLATFVRDQTLGLAASGEGRRLGSLSLLERAGNLKSLLANPLAIRLPGWRFSSLFDKLQGFSRLVVRPLTFWLIVAFSLFSLSIVVSNWSDFQNRLPAATEFFSQQNLLLILICLGATKILHEFGHALACRELGAECHEIGLMFLLFTPCLYCDVSDAWMIDSKWRRMAIAAAGMLVELFLASLATIVWWLSEPGFVNDFCLNLMFVCGVSTVLFNGNPLLRYDGYYLFSDWVGIPNLWSQSRNYLRTLVDYWLLGIEHESIEFKNRAILLGYAIASIVYRLLLLFLILYFLLGLLVAFHLEAVAFALLGVFALRVLLMPLLLAVRKLVALTYHKRLNSSRLTGLVALTLILVGLFFCLPLPHHVYCSGYLEFAGVQRVYVNSTGELESFVTYGSSVRNDDVLCQLSNRELELALIRQEAELEQNRLKLERLEAMRITNPSAGDEIPSQVEKLESIAKKLKNIKSRVGELTVRARRGGQLIAPQSVIQGGRTDLFQPLPFWANSPLSRKNVGALFEKGTLMGLVGKPGDMEAFAIVEQEEVDLVRTGQAASVMVSDSPFRKATGTVEGLTLLKNEELPEDVQRFLGQRFAGDISLEELTAGRLYLVGIQLPQPLDSNQFESARIRIRVNNTTLAFRLNRFLKRTFASLFD